MAGNTKIIPRLYMAYDYDREEDYINKMSKKGWQLKKGGLFHHTYMKDDTDYRYKLDYNMGVYANGQQEERYFGMFKEQGWEHINSTFNGWHYFRKKYIPGTDEEEYKIYTDEESYSEMHKSFVRIVRVIQVPLLLSTIYNIVLYAKYNMNHSLISAVFTLIGIIMLQVCISLMKRKQIGSNKNSRISRVTGYVLLAIYFALLALLLFNVFGEHYKYKIEYEDSINQDTKDYETTINISDSATYNLDVECESERGVVEVKISKDNDIIYHVSGASFRVDNKKLHLEKGKHKIEVIYYLEDFKEYYPHASLKEIEDYNLYGDLNDYSDVSILVGFNKKLFD